MTSMIGVADSEFDATWQTPGYKNTRFLIEISRNVKHHVRYAI